MVGWILFSFCDVRSSHVVFCNFVFSAGLPGDCPFPKYWRIYTISFLHLLRRVARTISSKREGFRKINFCLTFCQNSINLLTWPGCPKNTLFACRFIRLTTADTSFRSQLLKLCRCTGIVCLFYCIACKSNCSVVLISTTIVRFFGMFADFRRRWLFIYSE